MPLSDLLVTKVERRAYYAALTTCNKNVTFPETGSGCPGQRPVPGPSIQLWVRVVLRICSFQALWGVLFFALSLTGRRSLVGAVINVPYAGAALLGIYGALKLSYAYVITALLASLAVDVMVLVFCLWAYSDTQEWVVLALYLPGLGIDFFNLACCVPLALHLYRAEHSASYPAPPPAATQLAAARAEFAAARGAAAAAVAPAQTTVEEDEDPLAAVAEFRCPITLGVMVDPVIAADGHSYERVALEAWLRSHRTSPFTGAALEHMHVTPNHRLRQMIQSARENSAVAGRTC